ncbi:hypothetical protein DPMN_126854 [Dreissena polymorpha]|uniref:Secreted protein n=1 Tax=Dreissena polymorpha TaxID=45954 RepID=A0A9D4JYB2_DREPO|nr:hypothetical protein DPMN_126854 [Dreissena polymorpha]
MRRSLNLIVTGLAVCAALCAAQALPSSMVDVLMNHLEAEVNPLALGNALREVDRREGSGHRPSNGPHDTGSDGSGSGRSSGNEDGEPYDDNSEDNEPGYDDKSDDVVLGETVPGRAELYEHEQAAIEVIRSLHEYVQHEQEHVLAWLESGDIGKVIDTVYV